MATKKTAQRRAAELIAKADSIKLKSAQRRIQRAAKAQKPIVAPKALSSYGRRLFREVVRAKRSDAERKARPTERPRSYEPERIERRKFDYSGTRLMKLKGLVELGSSGSGDLRNRYVNAPVSARLANKILNAEDKQTAIDLFMKAAPYLVDVRSFEHIVFDGETLNEDFFE